MTPGLPYNENELLHRLTTGDTAALEHFYDGYYTSLVFYAQAIIHDQAQAEDIALECFVKLWQKRAEIESVNKLRGYLFTLARNACFDFIRHRHTRDAAHQQLAAADLTASAEASLVAADLLRIIYAEIKELSPDYRQLLELLYIEELSSTEAARQLGISIDNLRQRKARAVKQLKTNLLKKGISSTLLAFLFF